MSTDLKKALSNLVSECIDANGALLRPSMGTVQAAQDLLKSFQEPPFRPFADESISQQINGLTVENRMDRVSLYGFLDLTRDSIGLSQARQLQLLLTAVLSRLEEDEQAGNLPAEVSIEKPVPVDNPFQ